MMLAGFRMALAGLRMALPRFSGLRLAVLTGVITLGGIVGILRSGSEKVVEINVDMRVSTGTRLHLYVNDETKPPFRATLVEGARHVYKFAGAFSRITRIRLDPTDAKGASVEICGLSVADGRGPSHELGPVSTSTWGAIDAVAATASTGCTGFTSTSSNPIIYKDQSLVLENSRWPEIVERFKKLSSAPDTWPVLLMVAFLSIAGGGLRTWRRATLLALACGSIVILAVSFTTRYDQRLLAPTQALSLATYSGRPALGNRLAVQTSLVLSIVAALSVGAFSRRTRARAGAEPEDQVDPRPSEERFPRTAVGCALAILAVILTPDLRGGLRAASAGVFPLNWDMENVVLWQSLAHRGLVPLRDYWFPYGGTYLFDQPAPWGDLVAWTYQLLMFGGFFCAVVFLTGRRVAAGVTALLVVGLGEALDVFAQPSRYLLSVGIVLSHAAIDGRPGARGARVCFWILCALGVIFLPEQLVYAAPACVSKVLLDLSLRSDWRERRVWLPRLVWDLGVPALTLVAAMAVWWGSGQLTGTVDFYASLPVQAVYGAVPTDMARDLSSPSVVGFAIAILPFAFIGVGIYERLTLPGEIQQRAAQVLVGSGLLGWMLLQKHVVRPWGEWQFLTNLAVGVLIYAFLRTASHSRFRNAAAGIVAGCTLVPLAEPGVVTRLTQRVLATPARLVDNIRLLTNERPLLALDTRRFQPERFSLHTEERQAVDWLRRTADGRPFKVYVLGDAPVVYILLQQDPPWVANDYNASPLSQQKRVLDWLKTESPEFVVWNTGSLTSDSVPSGLRVPLIYQTVIDRYVPVGVSGRFQILRRRGEGEAPALDFWREKLGNTIELGYVPLASKVSARPSCQSGDCALYLQLTSPAEWGGGLVPFGLTLAGQKFVIKIQTLPGSHAYNIRLDRLWFWLTLAGKTDRPVVEWSGVPLSFRAESKEVEAGSSFLY
jgi:hypothetical protein